MKTIHLNNESEKKQLREWLTETKTMEKADKEEAIAEYKKIVSAYPTSETPYDRLMILYRLQKDYKEELHHLVCILCDLHTHFIHLPKLRQDGKPVFVRFTDGHLRYRT